MKSSRNILVVAFLTIITFTFAESPVASTMAIIANESAGVYKVHYKSLEAGKVKLAIYDSKQNLMFSEVFFNMNSFIRPYNFNGLSAGEYTVVLEDKTGRQVEKISYRMNKVESLVRVSKLTAAEGKFMLSVVNNGTESIRVNIYDAMNNLLHTQVETVTGNFALIYNLNKVATTTVKFEIINGAGNTTSIVY